MASPDAYKGIIPALKVPFRGDGALDGPELGRFAGWLSGVDGIVALMVNGHTGEVFALTSAERVEVTRGTVEAAAGRVPVISSVVCEGIADAVQTAKLLKGAGATALNVMPPRTQTSTTRRRRSRCLRIGPAWCWRTGSGPSRASARSCWSRRG